jgi:hypothetical protein
MMQVFALALFVAAVAVWLQLASRRKRHQAELAARRNTGKRYHCVEVRTATPACAAVRHFGHTRFLSREAPILPVSGCTVPTKCTCRYIHHDDRREDDRRNRFGRGSSGPPAIVGERRSKTDRRKSEEDDFRPSFAR